MFDETLITLFDIGYFFTYIQSFKDILHRLQFKKTFIQRFSIQLKKNLKKSKWGPQTCSRELIRVLKIVFDIFCVVSFSASVTCTNHRVRYRVSTVKNEISENYSSSFGKRIFNKLLPIHS